MLEDIMRQPENIPAGRTSSLLNKGANVAFVAENIVKCRAGDVLALSVILGPVDVSDVVRQRDRFVAVGKWAPKATEAVYPQAEDEACQGEYQGEGGGWEMHWELM